jgi:C1A family cysteine protease
MKLFLLFISFISIVCEFLSLKRTYSRNEMKEILTTFNSTTPKEFLFQIFHAYHKRKYLIKSTEAERRFGIFKKALVKILERNANKVLQYKLGITPFADLTHEEFINKYLTKEEDFFPLGNPVNETTVLAAQEKLNNSTNLKTFLQKSENIFTSKKFKVLPTKIDWTSKMNTVRNQQECGCCWSVSTIGSIEAAYKIQTNTTIAGNYLSIQHLIDCDKAINKGCGGGNPKLAMDYIIKNNGVMLENDYPFASATSRVSYKCQANSTDNKPRFQIKSYRYCDKTCPIEKWLEYLSKAPMVVYMDASSADFQHYVGGIYTFNKSDCKKVNHGVVAIGWGKTNGKQYVKVRNSWGTKWGEQGNFYVKYDTSNSGSCFITTSAVQPILS